MTTPISQLPTDDEGLANLVRAMTLTAHPVGTCRLGSAEDSDAVVDNPGRVIGVEGLRIADATIFPTVMSAGPNLATMMAAETLAQHIISQDNVNGRSAHRRVGRDGDRTCNYQSSQNNSQQT